jgi:WD40 repeat protein
MKTFKYAALFLLISLIFSIHPTSAQETDGIVITPENADQVVELMRIGRGQIDEFAVSLDGETLAIATVRGVWMHDTERLEEICFIESADLSSDDLSCPDSDEIVTFASEDKMWQLLEWSADIERFLSNNGPYGPINSVAYSPDSLTIASGHWDGTVQVWDAQIGTLLHTFEGHTGPVFSVSFSPDGSRIVSGSCEEYENELTQRWTSCIRGRVIIWDIETGKQLLSLDGHTGMVTSVAYSPDGLYIASGGGDNTARIWEAESGILLLTLEKHQIEVLSVVFSPNGALIATSSDGIRIWDVESGNLLQILDDTYWGEKITFSSDSNFIFVGSSNIQILSTETNELVNEIEGDFFISCLSLSPNDSVIAACSYNLVIILDIITGTTFYELEHLGGHINDVMSASFSSDGTRIVSASYNGTIHIWGIPSDDED